MIVATLASLTQNVLLIKSQAPACSDRLCGWTTVRSARSPTARTSAGLRAGTAQQTLAAGLADTVVLHVVPKLVGRGMRPFRADQVPRLFGPNYHVTGVPTIRVSRQDGVRGLHLYQGHAVSRTRASAAGG
jgi:hypothetical protein